MSNIDDQIAEISRQIQSLSESTIQHTPRGQGVRPKVVENKEHDSGVVTTGPSLSTPVGLAMSDTLSLPDRDIITNPQVNNRKSIGQDKFQNINPKQESKQNQSTAHTVSSGSNDVKIKPSKYDGLTPWMDYLSHFEMCALVNMWSEHQKEQFLDALVDSEMRLRIKQSRPKGLNDTIRLAVELEAYNKAEKTKYSGGGPTKGPDTDGSVKTLKSGDKAANKDKGAVISASEDAGMFVELLIHDILVKFVVDTGATLTLVSTKVYDLIPDLYRPHLSATKSQIKSACGNYLNLRGKGNFKLDFGTERFTSEAVVTELQVDGILGLDFMKKNNCLVDVSENILHFDNFKVPLLFQGTQNRNVHRKPCRFTSDRQSKTDRDCSKIEQSQVNIVTSKIPDKGKDLTLNELQSNDSDLKRVKRWLTEGQRPQYNEVSSKGYFLRSLWSQFGCLEVHGDVVVRRHDDREQNIVKLQAIIPMSERKQILEYCHDTEYAGHLGTHKTLDKIRQSFYWPGLQSEVRAYVTSCTKCNRKKRPMKRKRASIRLEEDNVRHESKRPAWMADYVNK
ncbi:unnamed protein product [Mytilus coruscus]|uniref:Uncharacterized protein n=1 Tax=Mytilus coruscus TaxID=42192 RepID=A0A6J8F0V0_MYTCO|nr:unnamed protein product [Mytilus coruscus]